MEANIDPILGLASDPVIVGDFNVSGAVFIIPVDAPLPAGAGEDAMPKGSLYARLAALCTEPADPELFGFVPLAGAELLALERPWRALQQAKRVYVLYDLPGARYETLFQQAARVIGLARVDWPAVADALEARARRAQRTGDKSPWLLAQPSADAPAPKVQRRPTGGMLTPPGPDELPTPPVGDED